MNTTQKQAKEQKRITQDIPIKKTLADMPILVSNLSDDETETPQTPPRKRTL